MFIELTALLFTEGTNTREERILVNISHIAMVRPKNSHAVLCYNQQHFTMLDVKESYGQVMGAIYSAIKKDANIRRLGHENRG